jgi:hypothetical protein
MTTFTTEDRIIAEQNGSVTINVEPIPFAGLITITETPKYKDLTDEEIWEVINRTAWVGTEEEIRFKIAEAILRKAQDATKL